jgi:uncharacterized protein (DUF2062 family)
MTDPFVIETRDLRKNYGGTEAVSGLTLQVPTGSIYGFLGRNGAGKTTTIKLLLTAEEMTVFFSSHQIAEVDQIADCVAIIDRGPAMIAGALEDVRENYRRIPLLSPAVGESYGVGSAMIHSLSLFVAGAAFFSLAFLLSTMFSDVWRPLLIALSVAGVLALCESAVPGLSRYSIFRVMSAETYFRTGALPWPGLLASAALSMALLYGAVVNMARQDF